MKKRTFAQLRKFATVIEKPKKNQDVNKIHQSDVCDCTRRAYLQFVEEGLGSGHEEKYYQTTDQRFLGDEGFVTSGVKSNRQGDPAE